MYKHSGMELSEPFSAAEILHRFYGENFEQRLLRFIEKTEGTDRICGISYKRVESAHNQPVARTKVDVIVEGRFSNDVSRLYRMRYFLDLRPCEKGLMGPYIKPYEEADTGDGYMTDRYLLPVMSARDYDRMAEQMLKKYFPTGSRDSEFVLDADELAERMDLTVKEVHFADSGILGQIYFYAADVELLDGFGLKVKKRIKPGTILISKDHCGSPAVRNSTIVHECCHMYLDRAFFLLQMMTGKPYAVCTNRRAGRWKCVRNAVGWMEYQAEKLPAYLLMNKKSVEAFLDSRIRAARDPDSISFLKSLIAELADHFHVSRSMAKYRMIELGYAGAEGISSFVDGKIVRNHRCAGKWPEGTTYTIRSTDAAALAAEDVHFEELLRSGKYRYVDGHVCLASGRYLEYGRDGLSLTYYARTHIDECCLGFSVSGRQDTDTPYEPGLAARSKTKPVTDKYKSRYVLKSEPGSVEYVKENEIFMKDSILWGELLYELPEMFSDAVYEIMKRKGMTQESLSLMLGIDRKSLYNRLNARQPSTDSMVAVCVALKLPYYISMKLIEDNGPRLRNIELHHLYRQMLIQAESLSIERCEDILREHGFAPFFQNAAS